MKKNKKSILIICPHPKGVAPGQRLKYEQYIADWVKNGYSVTISPFMTNKLWNVVYKKGYLLQKIFWTIYGYLRRIKNLFSLRDYDLVYVFLWVTPFGLPFFEVFVRLLSKKILYDIDDMVFLGHSSKANRFIEFFKGKRKVFYLIKNSNHVITCTPFLDDFVKKYNKNTTDISSTVNTDIYIPKFETRDSKIIKLGWSGSHSTSKYLYLLKNVFLELSKQREFQLIVIGDKEFNINGLNVDARQWSKENEVYWLNEIDIGLYPLPDEPWVYGKSGLKAIQYMALEIPTVASDVGTINRIIKNSENGFLVNSDEEWMQILTLLIDDSILRKKIGYMARKTIEKSFSVSSNKTKYLNIIESLV